MFQHWGKKIGNYRSELKLDLSWPDAGPEWVGAVLSENWLFQQRSRLTNQNGANKIKTRHTITTKNHTRHQKTVIWYFRDASRTWHVNHMHTRTTHDILSPNVYSRLLLKSVSFPALHVLKYSNYAHMFQLYSLCASHALLFDSLFSTAFYELLNYLFNCYTYLLITWCVGVMVQYVVLVLTFNCTIFIRGNCEYVIIK